MFTRFALIGGCYDLLLRLRVLGRFGLLIWFSGCFCGGFVVG